MDRRVAERRKHMPISVSRTCADLISNEGTEHRADTFEERECGLDADGYCADCAHYVCSIHRESNHVSHQVSNR